MNETVLDAIYEFLGRSHQYNKSLQERHYQSVVQGRSSVAEKVTILLYRTANTQSKPKIDHLAEFYKLVNDKRDKLSSFAEFTSALTGKDAQEPKYIDLYAALRAQKGWGDKTAALFCKSIFHMHCGQYDEGLKIWPDAPTHISEGDRLYLPVDAVILRIFQELGFKHANFKSVNQLLYNKYPGEQLVLWDDLWFWGFVTQNGSGDKRQIAWNENKYWCIEGSAKEKEYINEIRLQAEAFMALLRQGRT